ncbi:MAG: CoA transferase [bacterium]|nr:CoA transferase [bacterium]
MTALPLPLDGVRVLDFTQVIMGASATQLLGDYGAEVIKVERPGSGDIFRSSLPHEPGTNNPPFASVNRNKKSVELDPRSEDDAATLQRLIEVSDVIVNNFRPGVMERLGLGYSSVKSVNPQIIYAEATGFGPSGKYVHKGGQDILAQAYSGVMLRKADDAHPTAIYPTSIADYGAGMHLAQGILLALIAREKTGRGQKVEVSLYDSMIALQHQEAAMELVGAPELNWASLPLTSVFDASNGQIVIVGAFKENPLRDICTALDIDDLSAHKKFSDIESRKTNKDALHSLIEAATAQYTVEENLSRLESVDILCAPVRSLGEALADDHSAPMIVEVDGPAAPQRERHTGSPIHLSDTPARTGQAAPLLGADNEWLHSLFDPTHEGIDS